MRLDKALVARGLVSTRHQAHILIKDGAVNVNGTVCTKPSTLLAAEDALTLSDIQRYVSQGGKKLEAALTAFPVTIKKRVMLDVGASTGGFTDCALQHGAARVISVDVGHSQMHPSLRDDGRVWVWEATNALTLEADDVGDVDIFTVDVSFTGVMPIVRHLTRTLQLKEGIVLIKPQFETTKRSKRGIVRHRDEHTRVLSGIITDLKAEGIPVSGLIPSPIRGQHGNREYLLYLGGITRPVDIKGIISEVFDTPKGA